MSSSKPPPPKKRRRGGWIFLGVLVALAIAAVLGYREATAIPEFYAEVLQRPPPIAPKVAADKMERDVLTVQNSLQRAEPWKLVLREDEINSWLSSELATKAPSALPKEVKDPRIVFRKGLVLLAFKHEQAFGGVLSVELAPSLTEKTNEVAVRVNSVAIGRVPLPQQQYLDQISQAAAKAGVALTWREEDGVAVALATVPSVYENLSDRTVKVTSLEVGDGELVIHGTAERSK